MNWFENVGIPPPSVDIIEILKNPTLFNKPLYGNTENTQKQSQDDDLDAFCKAMGWTNLCGILPKKSETKSKRNRRFDEIDLSDVHKNFTKTNISKEMNSCILKGIQAKRDLKIPSEREAHRQRKVDILKNTLFWFFFISS